MALGLQGIFADFSQTIPLTIRMLSVLRAKVGIYGPLATLRLYKYFAEKTVAISTEKSLGFGYDIDQLHDFLFIWGQMLLTFITLGIYLPWAFCNVGSRVMGKTYLQLK